MSKIKVSVVLPVYNGAEHLGKCLDDILMQTLQEIEVICVNDGSTDNTLEILNEYAKRDSRIIVLDREQSGAGPSRNAGLAIAKGEYISFLDADDFYEPTMLEDAYNACVEQNVDMCIFRGDRYDNATGEYLSMAYSVKDNLLPKNNPFSYKDIPDRVFSFAVGWAWDKLYRREFVLEQKMEFQSLRTSNDLYFVFSSYVKAKSIYILDKHLVHHRINVANSLSVTRERSWHCFYEAASRLKEELVSMGVYEEVEKGFVNWALHFSFWNLDTINNEAYQNVYQLIKEKCISEFGFDQHDREYFADKNLYDRVMRIKELEYNEYLLEYYQSYRKELQEKRAKISSLQKENKKLKEENKKLKQANKKANKKYKKIVASREYRVGRVFTYIPRKLKRLFVRK